MKNKLTKNNKKRLYSLKRKHLKGGLNNTNNLDDDLKKEGIVDVMGKKIGNTISSIALKASDTGLKIIGLERINENKDNKDNKDENNILNKTGSSIIQNINEVLSSNQVKKTVKESAKETANILKEGAKIFNESLNDPEVRNQIEKSAENIGDISSVIVKASEKPFNEIVEVASKEVPKATGAAVSGLIKVGTDAMAAIPYVGSVIELGKMLNDGSKAASSIVEAGTEMAEVASDAFVKTSENVKSGLEELEEKKKLAENITTRTNKSIDQFVGGNKITKKRLFKNKLKSKKVRFSSSVFYK